LSASHSLVVRPGPELYHTRGREGLDQATQVSGVETEAGAQVAKVGPSGTDLEEHARLAKGPIAAKEVVVQRAHSLGDESIEASDVLDLLGGHCLTLVRQ